MTLPNFLFIGPDKTGSSWIFEYLRRHAQCFVPEAKDLYFFDREYGRGLPWYEKFFADAGDARAVGELSHDYILSDEVADRIKHDLPAAKLITVVRNPIERSWSHYLYYQRSGLVRVGFREALTQFPDIIENSRYTVMLGRYFSRFPKEQICVLYFDDLKADTQAFADQLTTFLQIDRLDAEDVGVVRPASKARFFWLARLMKIGAAGARAMGLQNLVGRVKHSVLGKSLYVPLDKSTGPKLSDEDRAYLREVFAEEIAWIEDLSGRDLSHW